MKFTKRIVEVIEKELNIKVSPEEIENGFLKRTINKKEIMIKRLSDGSLRSTARFVWDDYFFANGSFSNPDMRFIVFLRQIR